MHVGSGGHKTCPYRQESPRLLDGAAFLDLTDFQKLDCVYRFAWNHPLES
jgi:hypothetical protein